MPGLLHGVDWRPPPRSKGGLCINDDDSALAGAEISVLSIISWEMRLEALQSWDLIQSSGC